METKRIRRGVQHQCSCVIHMDSGYCSLQQVHIIISGTADLGLGWLAVSGKDDKRKSNFDTTELKFPERLPQYNYGIPYMVASAHINSISSSVTIRAREASGQMREIYKYNVIYKLDGHGRARREAARRRKSECKINFRKTKFISQ